MAIDCKAGLDLAKFGPVVHTTSHLPIFQPVRRQPPFRSEESFNESLPDQFFVYRIREVIEVIIANIVSGSSLAIHASKSTAMVSFNTIASAVSNERETECQWISECKSQQCAHRKATMLLQVMLLTMIVIDNWP